MRGSSVEHICFDQNPAWAGSPVIWVGILGIYIAIHDGVANALKDTEAPATQVATVLDEERRLQAELGPNEPVVAEKPKLAAPGLKAEAKGAGHSPRQV
jgi:hypothetical protein